jgi:futalosine hydrolase
MMNCLIIAATTIEIMPFLEYLNHTVAKENEKYSMDILVSGIGLTATTYSLMKQIQIKRPHLIIQAGVGGCFDTKIPLGTVLAISQEAIADQSVIELDKLKTLFDLKLLPGDQYPFSKGWLNNKSDILKRSGLKKVKGISVNEITTSEKRISFYKEKFNPVIESMEGAALHYVGLMEKIPFLQLRAVSNYVGERKKKNWNMKESVANLNRELIKVIERI